MKNMINPPVNVSVIGDGNDISQTFMNEKKMFKFLNHVKKHMPGTRITFQTQANKIII